MFKEGRNGSVTVMNENSIENESEYEKLTITSSQYDALNDIRGLDEKAFYLVVGATHDKSGRYILHGKTEAFDALARDVADEIYYELSPKSRLKHLRTVYRRLEPDCDDF